jgi:hypothetical protein
MEDELRGIPPILVEIIKSCLSQDHTQRLKSAEIMKKLKVYFTNNKLMISTNDDPSD